MAHLFSKSAIKQTITLYQGFDLSREIAIVQELYQDFCNGNMADETRYEQRFNNLFFGQLLGYEENIHRHPKASTPVGSKIADVGLGFFLDGLYSYEGVKVVVELKGATTLLDKKQASYGGQSPVDQGFGYKTSYQDCPWLIVSNFASVRLYRDNKQDFEVWMIEDLVNPEHNYYHLQTLLGLLKRNHLIAPTGSSLTEKLLSEVRVQQEQITKKFYKEYKDLRFELINDIRLHNPDLHVELIVEKAQKIIDRIIFIHFCEDKGLLPADKLKTNLLRGHELDLTPREVIKIYCRGVDTGSEKLGIPNGYNGGLFHDDPVLNELVVGNAICMKFIDLGTYDFDDELSVNILGHIFEQSISDIEQLKVDLLGHAVQTDQLVEKKESKRKKDGIFYTPEYIVDYIVQNSLMKYLEEQEQACLAKIGKKGGYATEILAYQAYQQILQQITVLDPACGSGAFLVKVFDYLYDENKRVGDIVGSLFSTDEIYKSILRNNIYGVDLNPESVEITKLSLWLKSAQKGKKLNNLDANIKCGNSLIDDPAVAGERAFDRNKEFADILQKNYTHPVMLTFATKYSRIPEEEYSKKRYDALMETGKEPVILQPEGVQLIRDAIREQIDKMGCILLNMAILPDHVHVTLVPLGNEISEIANKIKGYSAYVYNRALQGTETEQGQQNTLRVRGYSATILDDENHLHNALHYVDHNHLKHRERRGEDLLSNFQHPSDQRGTQPIPYEQFVSTSGGFDVIVGNPPYVQIKNGKEIYKSYFTNGSGDLYALFYEKSGIVLKKNGYIGFITPSLFIKGMRYESLRNYIEAKFKILEVIDHGDGIFADVQMPTLTFIAMKNDVGSKLGEFIGGSKIIDKLEKGNIINLKEISKIMRGLEIGKDRKTNIGYEIILGEDLKRYGYKKSNIDDATAKKFMKNKEFFEGKRVLIRETGNTICSTYIEENILCNRSIYSIKLLEQFDGKYIQAILGSSLMQYIYITKFKSNTDIFPKIRIGQVQQLPIKNIPLSHQQPFIDKADLMLSLNKDLHDKTDSFLRYISSKFGLEKLSTKLQKFYEYDFGVFLKEIEKCKGNSSSNSNSNTNLGLKPQVVPQGTGVPQSLGASQGANTSQHTTQCTGAIKSTKKLSMIEESELMEFFDTKKLEILSLKNSIDETDREIDEMVFELYGLSEEEKRVVLDS